MKKTVSTKIISVVLALAMVFAALPLMVWAVDSVTVKTFDELVSALKEGGTVVLGNDISAEGNEIILKSDVSCVLDTNGKTLSFDGNAFRVYSGNLTLTGKGEIICGEGGIDVRGGALNINDVKLSNSKSANSVTAYVIGGDLVLNKGTVLGGVVPDGGSFTMNGGTVNKNVGVECGNFTMNGGTVTEDVDIYSGSFTMNGGTVGEDVRVEDGAFTMNDGTVGGHIYVYDGKAVMYAGTVNAGTDAKVRFGVTCVSSPEKGGEVTERKAYDQGSSATVTAIPEEGYEFVKWTEDGTEVSTDSEYTFDVTKPCTLTAVFSNTSDSETTGPTTSEAVTEHQNSVDSDNSDFDKNSDNSDSEGKAEIPYTGKESDISLIIWLVSISLFCILCVKPVFIKNRRTRKYQK